jgi:hypothetical protein
MMSVAAAAERPVRTRSQELRDPVRKRFSWRALRKLDRLRARAREQVGTDEPGTRELDEATGLWRWVARSHAGGILHALTWRTSDTHPLLELKLQSEMSGAGYSTFLESSAILDGPKRDRLYLVDHIFVDNDQGKRMIIDVHAERSRLWGLARYEKWARRKRSEPWDGGWDRAELGP